MKISKLSTDKALDVLCEITPYITSILSDEALMAEIKKKIDEGSVKTRSDMLAVGAEKLNKIIPLIFAKNKAAIFGIIGALHDKSADEIAKQNILTTAKQLRKILSDKDLIDFFKSCMDTEGDE